MNMEYDELISFSNLYKAYLACLKGKRHKQEVIDFSLELSKNLWMLHYDLKFQKYKIAGYHEFKIYDPKERMIQAISFRDRIVQHMLVDNYLIPTLGKTFILDNVACQKNKGTSFAHRRIKSFLVDQYKKHGRRGYVIKIDIRRYFESIDHDYLKERLVHRVADNKIKQLLLAIIDSYPPGINKGLPMGNQTSQYFALLYLSDIDHYIKEKLRIKYYLRYMDDLLLIVQTKEEAKIIFFDLSNKIEEHLIKVNPKSQYFPLINGFEMIGWRYFLTNTGKIIMTVRKSTKKRIKLGLCKSQNTKYHKNESQIIAAYKGFLRNGNSYRFSTKLFD